MNPIFLVLGMTTATGFVLAMFGTVSNAMASRRLKEEQELVRRLNTMSDSMRESLFHEQARDSAVAALGNLGEHLQSLIEQADSKTQVSTLIIQMGVVSLVCLILGIIFTGGAAGVIGVVLGILPYMWLRYSANKRAKALLHQLPEALDLMARSLQAGLGLNEAFRTCAEELPLPVAQEFGRVFEEVRFGRDYREALGNLARRYPDLFDLRLFVSSVLLQRETGGNLIEILESIASTIRGRFMFDEKVKALTAEAKISSYIVGSLPIGVAILITVVNNEYLLPLVEEEMGHMLLMAMAGLYSFGIFLLTRLARVDV